MHGDLMSKCRVVIYIKSCLSLIYTHALSEKHARAHVRTLAHMQLKGALYIIKYYADGIHSGLTPPS